MNDNSNEAERQAWEIIMMEDIRTLRMVLEAARAYMLCGVVAADDKRIINLIGCTLQTTYNPDELIFDDDDELWKTA